MATGFDIYQKSAKNAGLTAPSTGRSISSLLPKQEATQAITPTTTPRKTGEPTFGENIGTFFKAVSVGIPALMERETVGKKLAFEQAKGAGKYLTEHPEAWKAAVEKEKNRTWKDYLPKINIGTKLESGDALAEWVVTAAKESGYKFDARESKELKDYSAKVAQRYIDLGIENDDMTFGSVGLMIGESLGQQPFGAMPTPAGKAVGFLIGTRFNARSNLVQFAMQGMDINDSNVQKLALVNAAIDSSVESVSSLMGEGLALKYLAKSPVGKNIGWLQRFAGNVSAEALSATRNTVAKKTVGEMIKQTASNMLSGSIKVAQGATGEGLEEVWGDIGKAIATKVYLNPDAPLFTARKEDGGLFTVDSMMQSFALGAIAGGIFEGSTKLPSGVFSETRAWVKNFNQMTPEEAVNPEVYKQGEQALKNDVKNPINEPYMSTSLARIAKLVSIAREDGARPFKEQAKDINLPKVVPQVSREVSTRLKPVAKPQAQTTATAQAKAEPIKAEPVVAEPVATKQPEIVRVKEKPAKTAEAEAPIIKAEEKPVEVKTEKKPAETKTQEQKQEAIKKAVEKTAKLQKVLKPRRSVVATDEQSNSFNKLFEQAMEFVDRKAKKEDVKSSDIIKIDVNDSNMNAFMNLLFDKQNAIDNAIEDGLYTPKQILEEKFAVDVIQKYILQKMTFKKANKAVKIDEEFDFPDFMIEEFEAEEIVKRDLESISPFLFTPVSKQNIKKYADAITSYKETGSDKSIKRIVTPKNWTEFTSIANAYYHYLIENGMESDWAVDLLNAIENFRPEFESIKELFDVRIKHLYEQYNENYQYDESEISSMAGVDGLSTDIKSANYMGYVYPSEFNETEITLALLGEQMGFRVVVYENFGKAVNQGFFFPDGNMIVYVLRSNNKESQGNIVLNTLVHEIGHGIKSMGTVTAKQLKTAIWKSLDIKNESDEKKAFISLRSKATKESAKETESIYYDYKKKGKVESEIFAMRYAEIMTNSNALYEFTKSFEEKQIAILDRMMFSLRKALSFLVGNKEIRLAIKATQEAKQRSIKLNSEAVKYSNADLEKARFTKGIGKPTSAKYQPVGGVVDESIKANSIMKQPTVATKIETIKDFWNKNFWRSSVNIDYKEADLRNAVTLLRKSLSTASKLAYENMRSIYLGLTQDQMKFLQDAILYSDAYNDVQRGTFDVKHPPVEGWTPNLVTTHWKENIEPLLYPKDSALDTEENRKVRERFEKRKRLIKDYVNEVIDMGRKAGLDLSWINNREYYMQHIMIEFINQQSATAGKKKGKRLTSPFSGRKGESGLSYLTDPISVDYATIRHLSQTIAKLNMLETIYKYDITQERGFAKKYGLVKRSDGMYDENRLAELGLKQMLRQDLNISFDNIQKLTAEASKSLSDLKELASPFYKIVSWATDAKKLAEANSKVNSTNDPELKKFYQNVIKASTDAEFMTDMKLKSKIDIESISRIQNQLYSLNRKNVIIVPAEVADLIMNEIAPKKQTNIMEELARLQMSIFKPLMLTSAHKVFEYTARNTYNDVSVVTAFLPEVFAPYKKTVTTKDGATKTVMTNDVIEAFIELVKMYKHGEMSDRMRKYVMRGGIGGNMASIEIKDFAKDPNFQALYDTIKKTGALDKTGRAVIEAMKAMIGQNAKIESFVELREQILRYAAFIRFSKMIDEDLKAGGTGQPKFYYGSKRVEIQNLSNPVDRALKLSEDLMGAYGDVTPFTQGVAKGVYPFLRWKEVDMKRMFRVAQNILYKNPNDVASFGKTMANRFAKGAKVGTYAALRIGYAFIRLALIQGAMAAWNSMMPDDDDLPKEIRESLHITLPSWLFPDDRIHYIGGLNLVSEAANIFDWNSWTNFKDDIQTSLKYGLTPQEIVQRIIKDSATDQWNNLINGSNPFFKTAIEMTMGQSLYPDPSEPRKIRDPIEHLMTIAGLSNEYKAIVGKPIQGGNYLATLGDSVSNSVTKGDAALWTIRALRAEYEDAKGIGNSYGDTTDEKKSKRQDVAYNYKLSLRLGDKNAAKKWLMEYWSLGGTGATMKQSIDSLDPLFKMDNKVKRDFLAQLSEEDKATYEVAKQYVKDLQKLSRSEDYYVPKSAGTK